eukprot:6187399-Pleurochrysis_carterae.AAC.2
MSVYEKVRAGHCVCVRACISVCVAVFAQTIVGNLGYIILRSHNCFERVDGHAAVVRHKDLSDMLRL